MLLGLIAITIGVIILLAISGKLYDVITSITGKSECEIKFLLASPTKKGGVQFVEPNCAPHFVTIDENYINANKARASKTINDYVKKMDDGGKYTDLPAYTDYKKYFSSENKAVLNEWVVDEAVAKEMKYCWDITGRGKLDLFDEWHSFLKCNKNKGASSEDAIPCTEEEVKGLTLQSVKAVASNAGSIVWPFNWDTNEPPTFCVLCARIKFSPEVSLPNKDVTNFNSWLDNNPASESGSFSKVPYSTYVTSDSYKGIFIQSYSYSVDKPYAVVYARVNVHYLNKWTNTIGSYTGIVGKEPESVQVIKLIPYNDLRNKCTALVSG